MSQMFSCSLSTREHIATKEARPSFLLLWWKSLPSDTNIFEPRNQCKHHTWSAVEVAEHFGAGHCDSFSNVCRAPACDIVPDTTAAWKEKRRIRCKSWAMRTHCLEGDRRMSDDLNSSARRKLLVTQLSRHFSMRCSQGAGVAWVFIWIPLKKATGLWSKACENNSGCTVYF